MPRKLPKPREFRNPGVQVSPKYWMKPSRFIDMLAREKRLRERSALPGIMNKWPAAPSISDATRMIAKKAEQVMQFSPTALVAVDTRGLAAARLVEHYIKRKTGNRLPVYLVRPIGASRFSLTGAELVNPANKGTLMREKRLAVIDDVRSTGSTMLRVRQALEKNIRPATEVGEFPIIDLAGRTEQNSVELFIPRTTISPTHRTKKESGWAFESGELGIHGRFIEFQAYRSALDDYMTARGIGVDKRRSSPRR